MNKIYYEKIKFIYEPHEFEIKDMKNVFLIGRDSSNRNSFFGLWTSSKGTKIVTIRDNKITFDYSLYTTGYSRIPIKNFLEKNGKVEMISKESFFEELEKVKNILSE